VSQKEGRTCFNCGSALAANARFCSYCGMQLDNLNAPVEVALTGTNRLQLTQDTLSVRDLLGVVEAGVSWWQQKLQHAEGVDRRRAAEAIKELSQILESLSEQLAHGRETMRITARLPPLRVAEVACPFCGRGNRSGARFCLGCGQALADAPATPAAAQSGPMQLAIAGHSDVGRVRSNNEDVFYAGELHSSDGLHATLLMVADGMGGAEAGDIASTMARDLIKQELVDALNQEVRPADESDWQALLQRIVVSANHQIYAAAQADLGKRGMGTTLTLAVLHDYRVHIAHVGDSRAYLLNAGGVDAAGRPILQLTSDHSIVARLVDIGQLSPEQARQHPHRNMLYRSLGTEAAITVDCFSHTLQSGDRLLLSSDGLDTYVTPEEMAAMAMHSRLSPQQVCARLIGLANARGGRDNISVVLAEVRS
jgi:PPM family protein phosphatase